MCFRYLEREITHLDDPYQVAIVTWALYKADSEYKDLAFAELHKIRRVAGM